MLMLAQVEPHRAATLAVDLQSCYFLGQIENLVSIHVECVSITSQRGNGLSVFFLFTRSLNLMVIETLNEADVCFVRKCLH